MKKFISILFIFLTSLVFADPYPQRFEGLYPEYGGNPLELIQRFIPENPVIFEAGAHYGEDSIKFATRWPLGKILSFEPNPHAFELFLKTTEGYSNIYGFPIAISNYNGTATLYVCYGTNGNEVIFEGASSLLEPSEEMEIHYQGPKVEVPCMILDDWCEINGIHNIDFMWLDMEGLELQVLSASPKIFDTVKAIYVETNFYKFRKGTTLYNDLKNFLESKGFKMLSHWYMESIQGNAIFVRKELYPQI